VNSVDSAELLDCPSSAGFVFKLLTGMEDLRFLAQKRFAAHMTRPMVDFYRFPLAKSAAPVR